MKKGIIKILSLVLLTALMLCFASCGSVESAAKDADKILDENWLLYTGDSRSWFYYETELTTLEGQEYYWVDVKMTTAAKSACDIRNGQIIGQSVIRSIFEDSTIYNDVSEEFEKYPEIEVMIIFYDSEDEPAYYFYDGKFSYFN